MSCYNTSVSGLLGSSNKSAISVERIILGAYKKFLGRQHSLALVDPAPNFRGGAQTFVNPGGGNTVETHTTLPCLEASKKSSKSSNMTFSMLSPFSLLAVELFLVPYGGIEFVGTPILLG